MKLLGSWTTCALVILMGISITVDARRLALRPLSLKELRRALRESGQLDDTPAGRSVASALAGIKGFALGITKGVGGSILFDVVTANATLEYVSNLLSSASSSSDSDSSGTAQEICFRSRSLEGELIRGRSSADTEEQERAGSGTTSTDSGTGTGTLGSTTGTTSGGSSGLTCIVLNKGRRRRDTLANETPRQHTEKKRVQRNLRKRFLKNQR
ncbi:uncharacterized protein Dwil_GK23314 [Drosophila willistoni]|uniref:Uncharacterized protein n=1 Tax=Drosophila willistoni TaxID=7260 RepID=B4NNH4_DROWI|nr:uncharacterized protein LOC6652186 [Drosophila willistoni]EDW85913.2 uncharacterized protein Dwil_GK23314 [Drosophila willistoni]